LANKLSLSSVVLLCTTGILLVYVSCIGIRNSFRYNRYKIEHNYAIEQLDLARKKHANLHRHLAQIEDRAYWELKAREIGFIAQGDVVYKVLAKSME
jgi:hypothetical protein